MEAVRATASVVPSGRHIARAAPVHADDAFVWAAAEGDDGVFHFQASAPADDHSGVSDCGDGSARGGDAGSIWCGAALDSAAAWYLFWARPPVAFIGGTFNVYA